MLYLSLAEVPYTPETHPLIDTLTVLNKNLHTLELCTNPPLGPNLQTLLETVNGRTRGNHDRDVDVEDASSALIWNELKELVISPIPMQKYDMNRNASSRWFSSEAGAASFASTFVDFLVAHPSIETLRFTGPTEGRWSQGNTTATQDDVDPGTGTTFLTFSRPPPSVLGALPVDALPNLDTFQSPYGCIQDVLHILDPCAGRKVTRLSHVSGRLDVKETSQTELVHFSAFTHSLASAPSLTSLSLWLGPTQLGSEELTMLLSSVPHVKYFILVAWCTCPNFVSSDTP